MYIAACGAAHVICYTHLEPDFGVIGEWRFERKCFRSNVETCAVEIRRIDGYQ